MNYFGIQVQDSTKAQISSEDNVKTWLISNFRCFAPVPGILLFNYLLHVCIYSLICIPPLIFRTFSRLNYIIFFQVSVGNRGFSPALQHPALPGVCHSTSTKETTLYYPASNFSNCFAPKLWLRFPPWYAILYLLGHIYPWGFFLFIVGLLLLLL